MARKPAMRVLRLIGIGFVLSLILVAFLARVAPVAAGAYSLHVGLYLWETQVRLSATQGGEPVPEATPRVGKVAVAASGD